MQLKHLLFYDDPIDIDLLDDGFHLGCALDDSCRYDRQLELDDLPNDLLFDLAQVVRVNVIEATHFVVEFLCQRGQV